VTIDDIKARFGRYEWNDVEFKAARREVPKDAYKSVSAFANTNGGYLVFGVEQKGKEFSIVGVLDVDKVQNDFLSALRSGEILNRVICVQESALEDDEGCLLVFYVPESPRREKPVYLHGDIRTAHVRRGGGDEKCTKIEIERFLRDASESPFDGEAMVELSSEDFSNRASLAWYRRVYQDHHRGKHAELNDVEFLHEFGFVKELGDRLVPTKAAVLLFGEERNVRQLLSRPVADYQRFDRLNGQADDGEVRWDDRVVIEGNLIQAWQTLFEKYAQVAQHKFSLDASTMRRNDNPPDFVTFREAVVNLLVHQDFGDSHRTPIIKIFRDETHLFNPGDAFASATELLDPGTKEVRNPTILGAFRRIGLSDQAGTGIRAIFRESRQQGHVPPVIVNDKSKKFFGIVLNRTRLLTEEQRLFQAQLGVRLSDEQARLFAVVCAKGTIEMVDAKAALAQPERAVLRIIERLEVQQLVERSSLGLVWTLKPHLKEAVSRLTDQAGASGRDVVTSGGDQARANRAVLVSPVSDQAGHASGSLVTPKSEQAKPLITKRLLKSLTATQKVILRLCDVPKRQEDLMIKLGVSHRTHFRSRQLHPLLDAGLIRQTHPENPTHPHQAYVVTEAAVELLTMLLESKD
jgi:ATP-dependent DNA helicase RecG